MKSISEATEQNMQMQIDALKQGNEELLAIVKQQQDEKKQSQNQAFDSKLNVSTEDKGTQTRMKMKKSKKKDSSAKHDQSSSFMNITNTLEVAKELGRQRNAAQARPKKDSNSSVNLLALTHKKESSIHDISGQDLVG